MKQKVRTQIYTKKTQRKHPPPSTPFPSLQKVKLKSHVRPSLKHSGFWELVTGPQMSHGGQPPGRTPSQNPFPGQAAGQVTHDLLAPELQLLEQQRNNSKKKKKIK